MFRLRTRVRARTWVWGLEGACGEGWGKDGGRMGEEGWEVFLFLLCCAVLKYIVLHCIVLLGAILISTGFY
jgi:hypothetical protein